MKKVISILTTIFLINSISLAFSDVATDNTYKKAIDTLVEKKIINGYEDNTFRPSSNITRAEMVKILVSSTGANTSQNNLFVDVPEEHWAKEFINIGVANGYVQGDGDGNFRPDDTVTYGEVATMLVRAMGYEKSALELKMEWPNNYMNYAEKLGIFDNYKTNDLTAINLARRDNVALMIYNMLEKKAEEVKETEKDNNKIQNNATVTERIDTQTAFTGIVTKIYEKNSETILKVKDYSKTEIDLKVYSRSLIPEVDSFIIYQFKDNGTIKIRKEISVQDFSTNFAKITDVDDGIITIENEDKVLNLELDEYKPEGKIIKLNKYKYFIIKYDKDEKEFTSYSLCEKEKLKLKVNDKIRFEDDLNACFIIR